MRNLTRWEERAAVQLCIARNDVDHAHSPEVTCPSCRAAIVVLVDGEQPPDRTAVEAALVEFRCAAQAEGRNGAPAIPRVEAARVALLALYDRTPTPPPVVSDEDVAWLESLVLLPPPYCYPMGRILAAVRSLAPRTP